MKKIILLTLLCKLVFAGTPADSLLQKNDISIVQRAFIYPISCWQKLSFGSSALNCQFAPSCSQYTAMSIAQHGVIGGIILGTDRIIRCNPAAQKYYMCDPASHYHTDGRLLDTIPDVIKLKKPTITTSLVLIPGLYRYSQGKSMDGFYSFLIQGSLGVFCYSLYEKEHKVSAAFAGMMLLTFRFADIYNALKKVN